MNSEFGLSMLTTTVFSSGVSMELTPAIMKDGSPWMFFSRSNVHLTSLASTGLPSEKTASAARVNVNWVWSSFAVHSVASEGTTDFSSGPSFTRP